MSIKTALTIAALAGGLATVRQAVAAPLNIPLVPQTRAVSAGSALPPATGPIIKDIKITANTPDGLPGVPEQAIEWVMSTKQGQAYNADVLAHDLDRLFNHKDGFLRAEGLIADAGPGVHFDPSTGVLTLPILEAHVSHIIVTGSHTTNAAEIMKQMHTDPGDVYNDNVMQQDMERIFNMNLFSQVGPWQVTPTDVGLVDVSVPVVDK